MDSWTGATHGNTLWGPAVGSSQRDNPCGVPMGPGLRDVADKGSQAEGQGYHSSPPHSHCCPWAPKNDGNIMVGVLGCAGGCAWCFSQPPSCRVDFALFFLCFYFLPKPSSCHLQPLPPPDLSRLPPTPFPSLPRFPFQMENVTAGVLRWWLCQVAAGP